MQDSTAYSVDIPGLHARLESLAGSVSVLTNVVARLVSALDTPAIRASVESAGAIQACLLRSCEHTAKRLESLSRFEVTSQEDGPSSLQDMMALAAQLGGGGGGVGT